MIEGFYYYIIRDYQMQRISLPMPPVFICYYSVHLHSDLPSPALPLDPSLSCIRQASGPCISILPAAYILICKSVALLYIIRLHPQSALNVL